MGAKQVFAGRDSRTFLKQLPQLPVPERGHLPDAVSLIDRSPEQKQFLDLFLGVNAPVRRALGNDRPVAAFPGAHVSRGIPVSLATALIGYDVGILKNRISRRLQCQTCVMDKRLTSRIWIDTTKSESNPVLHLSAYCQRRS